MKSQYAKVVSDILAEMEQGRETDDGQSPPDKTYPDQQGEPEKKIVFVYRTDDGGIFLSPTKVEEDESETPIVASETRPTARRSVPLFVHFLLILFLFVSLDNIDTLLLLLAPTVTVTITPQTQALTTTATVTVGEAGADVHGRVLQPLTLTQSRTSPATGHGHQDAQRAAGELTFYNGQLQRITIPAGTVFTGGDGIQIATAASVTLPPADPTTTPPTYGQVYVSAQAIHPGASGNIQAFDISGSCCAASVIVKNLAPFSNGRDARDFIYVSKADIQNSVAALTPVLLQSERAALNAQLSGNEALVTPTCTPRTTTNHNAGDEAASVTVLVSQTCSTVVYNQQELQKVGIRIQTRAASLQHFQQVGEMHVSILSQRINGQQAAIKIQIASAWVYQINESRIKALIVGKHRLDALHKLTTLPGIQQVSITGISDNQQLPTDPAHIHLNIFYFVS